MVNQFEDLEAPAEEKRDTEAAAAISDIKVKATRDMDLLLDIPLNVKAELGRTKMSIKEILKLKIGTVVELAKLVGEPMEVYINGLLIARGEVVVVNEKFGIRITDVIDPLEVRRLAL